MDSSPPRKAKAPPPQSVDLANDEWRFDTTLIQALLQELRGYAGRLWMHTRTGKCRRLVGTELRAVPRWGKGSDVKKVGEVVICNMDGLRMTALRLYAEWEVMLKADDWALDPRYVDVLARTDITPLREQGLVMTRSAFEGWTRKHADLVHENEIAAARSEGQGPVIEVASGPKGKLLMGNPKGDQLKRRKLH